MSDSEDPELEEELQAADKLLQDMQNDAQSEPQPRPVRWKKRDRQGDFIPQRPSTSRSTTCMPRVSRDQHQCPREETSYVTSVNPTKVYGTEVLRQELLQLLEDGEEDAAMTCETSSESAATHWAIRNMFGCCLSKGQTMCVTAQQSFYDIKKAAPGMSLKAFVKMLDERTAHFGRTGRISADAFSRSFLEWSAVKFEVDRMCKEPCFSCPACTPDMLAVSVDGNRKLYRFQSNASTSEQGNFEGVFIEKDEDVAEFVKYIQRHTNHAPGKGLCGSSSWTAAKESSKKSTGKLDEEGMEIAVCRHGVLLAALNMFRGEIFAYPLFLQRKLAANVPGHITFLCSDVACKYFPYLTKVAQQCPELRNLLSMRPFLSVMHAKAHTWKCEIKWGGAFQDGAGSTVGEEVEQVNSFLSRAAITTKYMSKAGRTDMLTLLALGWNKRKVEQLGRTLSQRYLKIIRILREQVESLNATKNELGVDDDTLQQWVADVQKWAEETDQTDGSLGALQGRIEELVVIIRVRTQSLYRQNDSNKRRHRIRKVILDEKKRLAAAVDDYNKLAEPTKQIVSSDALIQTDIWPWQSTSEPSLVGMSEDAQKGLHSLVLKKQSELKAEMLKVKDMYKRILSYQPLLEMDSEEEEDILDDATESDLSTSDED
ncbi:hypothetical protein ACER0C_021241 [Sarotherodon galilaeus]